MRIHSYALAAATMVVLAAPAMAQKSKDTVRLAINDPFSNVSSYCIPAVEVSNFSRRIYSTLIGFDEHKQKFVPILAKSWKRINKTTLELELRDDIKFHNGNKFDADDVITTFAFLQDPKVKIRYKSRYKWLKRIDKISPYKIRLIAARPTATDLSQLAYRIQIQDAESYKSLDNPCDYGRKTPYGTGAFKVVSIDRNKGILVERFEGDTGNNAYLNAPIKRVHGIPIPDRQTQEAELRTGGIDIIQNVPADTARNLKGVPGIDITTHSTGAFIYIVMDSKGRTANKAMQDKRVRRAIIMALDRDTIIKHIVPGGDTGHSKKMMGFCFDYMAGCKYSVDPPKYDPEGAKKLLAEAGYPNGFDLEYTVFNPIKTVGEAIAGELRKIGIRTRVKPVTIGVFYKTWVGGKTEMVSVNYPAFTFPDAGNLLDTFFGGPRDYTGSDVVHQAMKEGAAEFDPKKRAAIYERAFNDLNRNSHSLAFSSLSTVFAHSKDVAIKADPLAAGAKFITDYHWK